MYSLEQLMRYNQGSANLANKIGPNYVNDQLAADPQRKAAAARRAGVMADAQGIGQRLASPGFGAPLGTRPTTPSPFNADIGNGLVRHTAGGVNPQTAMNSLPPTAFGGANPGIASNNLAMAKARGGMTPGFAGPIEGGGSRSVNDQGRVSVVGRPLQGYQPGVPTIDGFSAPNTSDLQRSMMGLAPRDSNRRETVNPKREAYSSRLADRRESAREKMTAMAQIKAGKVFNEDNSVDMLSSIAAGQMNRNPQMSIAAIMGDRGADLAERKFGLEDFVQRGETELAADRFAMEKNKTEKQSLIDQFIAIGTPQAMAAASRLVTGQDSNYDPTEPLVTPNPETNEIDDEQIDTMLSHFVNGQGLSGPALLDAMKGKISKDRLSQYTVDASPGMWDNFMDHMSYAFTLPGNFDKEADRLRRKRQPFETLSGALKDGSPRPITFK